MVTRTEMLGGEESKLGEEIRTQARGKQQKKLKVEMGSRPFCCLFLMEEITVPVLVGMLQEKAEEYCYRDVLQSMEEDGI